MSFQLKKWVERGKEAEAANDPSSAPPPTFASLASSNDLSTSGLNPRVSASGGPPPPNLPPGAKKAVSKRYVLQSNLSVSSSMASMTDLGAQGGTISPSVSASASFTNLIPPSGPAPAPPSGGPLPPMNFFIPTPPTSINEGGKGSLYASYSHKSKWMESATSVEPQPDEMKDSPPPPLPSPEEPAPPPAPPPNQFFTPTLPDASSASADDSRSIPHADEAQNYPPHSPGYPHQSDNSQMQGYYPPDHQSDNSQTQGYYPPEGYPQHYPQHSTETEAAYNTQHYEQMQSYYQSGHQEQSYFSYGNNSNAQASNNPGSSPLEGQPHPLGSHEHEVPIEQPYYAASAIHTQASYDQEGSASLHSWGRIDSHATDPSVPPSQVNSLPTNSSFVTPPSAALLPPPLPPPPADSTNQCQASSSSSTAATSAPLFGLHHKSKEIFSSVLSNLLPTGLMFIGGGRGGDQDPGPSDTSLSPPLEGSEGQEDDFDLAMHPGKAGKLDGPLPWELPDEVKYSDKFLSTCTTWQRQNPGAVYRRPGGGQGQALVAGGPGAGGGGGVGETAVAAPDHGYSSLSAPLPPPLSISHLPPPPPIAAPQAAPGAGATAVGSPFEAHPYDQGQGPSGDPHDSNGGLIPHSPSGGLIQVTAIDSIDPEAVAQDGWDFEASATAEVPEVLEVPAAATAATATSMAAYDQGHKDDMIAVTGHVDVTASTTSHVHQEDLPGPGYDPSQYSQQWESYQQYSHGADSCTHQTDYYSHQEPNPPHEPYVNHPHPHPHPPHEPYVNHPHPHPHPPHAPPLPSLPPLVLTGSDTTAEVPLSVNQSQGHSGLQGHSTQEPSSPAQSGFGSTWSPDGQSVELDLLLHHQTPLLPPDAIPPPPALPPAPPAPQETLDVARGLLHELEEMRRTATASTATATSSTSSNLFSPPRGVGGGGGGASTSYGGGGGGGGGGGASSSSSSHFTPTKMQHDSTMDAEGQLDPSTMLQTPQRPAPPPSPYSRTQDSPGGPGVAGGASSSNVTRSDEDAINMSVEERLEALRRELTSNFEAQLSSQAAELQAKFEEHLAQVRRELTHEYERRLEEREAELEEQRKKSLALQEDLDQLLLCLGQEGRKVESLEEAMRKAGLDPLVITRPIDDEYAAMDS